MIRNYLLVAWRNLRKNRVFSFINIFGLALGLTCSIFIALWVIDEYSVDSFHKDIERIFIVTSREYSGTEINGSYDTPGLLGEELKKEFPEVELACNTAWQSWQSFAANDKLIKLPGNFAGEDFFSIFSYLIVAGSGTDALKSPESISISRKMAELFFGSPEAALNKTIRYENYRDLKVTAVFENLQNNVSSKFEYIINWDLFVERNSWVKDFNNSGPTTYIKLKANTDPERIKPRLQHFIKKYDKEYSSLNRLELGLQPFSETYLHSNFKNGYLSGGRIEYVRIFQIVAMFILLIACINFMNLSTARSIKRAKEIGVRKVIGARKKALIFQFLSEAFFLTSISIFLAIILLQLLLPQFNVLTGKKIISPLTDIRFWAAMAALTVITGVIAGSYPALLLSSFRPIAVLKNKVTISSYSVLFRKGLVVFQFALSVIFIIGMLVISKQVSYIQNKHLGYQKNNLIYVALTGTLTENFQLFKDKALQIPGIVSMSFSSQRPFQIGNSTGSVEWDDKIPGSRPTFTQAEISYDFIKVMQAELVSGREFSKDFADSNAYIINEAALKTIGYENPVGRTITFWGVKGPIIGIVKDFHFNSLHMPITPLVLRLNKGRSQGYALIRNGPKKTASVISGLEQLHHELNPAFPFAHQFADEEYFELYQSEQVAKQLSLYFALLAISISCLGLLGLVIFTTEQRTREVGIRKVLGANVSDIVALISKDFLKLVIVSIVVASPVAWYVMNSWLEDFPYHEKISWKLFAISGGSAIAIALFTIGYQAIKSAMANPVESLRAE